MFVVYRLLSLTCTCGGNCVNFESPAKVAVLALGYFY
jgi:hypothetical protein